MHKLFGVITHPCPNTNGDAALKVRTWISNYITHVSLPWSLLNYVSQYSNFTDDFVMETHMLCWLGTSKICKQISDSRTVDSELWYNKSFEKLAPCPNSRRLNHQRQCCLISVFTSHYCDVIMSAMTSQITGVSIVYSTVYSSAGQRKHQSSASLAFVVEREMSL